MFQTTTFFIKGQVPSASLPLLLEGYQQELDYRRVSQTSISGNTLNFVNLVMDLGGLGYGKKIACFTSGRILIEETATKFIVTFEADLSRTLKLGGIISGFVMK